MFIYWGSDFKNVTVSGPLLSSRSTYCKFWVTHLPTVSSVFPEPLLLLASLNENHFLWMSAPVSRLSQSSQLPFCSAPTSRHCPRCLLLSLPALLITWPCLISSHRGRAKVEKCSSQSCFFGGRPVALSASFQKDISFDFPSLSNML